ncbi:MAG: branched-chain amino acid transaminase [Candidatus Thermoplasmatota archaeon]|nr:branched-chain amino acid transaminase [Candidatus Thermoplasmatota archaeon]MBS3789502.1 branched-chain amino acid transaminase [Candidatus Thermoplasmatota archaeon]
MKEVDYIWMDGEFVEWDDAKIHVLSHVIHYGTGVFEGIRAYDNDGVPAVFRLDDHMERFVNSAKIINLELDYDKEKLISIIDELISKNGLKSCYIRPVAFRGYGSMGVNPLDNPINISIAVWPWGEYLGEGALENGVKVQTTSWTRHHPNIFPTKAKASGNYLNSVMAKMEAVENDCVESIMLNPTGYVAEGTGENLFLVRDGELYTPQTADVLEGITRDSVIQISEDLGYPVNVEKITRDQIYISDEAFFVGTAAEVTPIKKVDRRKISDGKGPVTDEIQERYMKAVKGEIEKYQKWLYKVE